MSTINGTSGDDVLDGQDGQPTTLIGGLGNDIYYVDHVGDLVFEAAGEGRDVVYASVDYRLNAGTHVEVLSARGHALTTPLSLTGNELGQEVWGNAGANLIDGGAGADTLVGLGGNDIYYVDNSGDRIVEGSGGGARDVVYASVDYRLNAGAQVEVLSARGHALTTPLSLTGNELGQEVWGNAGANLIDGGAGADTLVGLGGNDIYYVDHEGDRIVEAAGGGTRDVVYASVDYRLNAGAQVEVLSARGHALTTPLSLTGNELGQEVWGNAGSNVIDGGGGADTLVGLGGNDIYYVDHVGDRIVEGSGGGTRDIVYASVDYRLNAGAEVEVLSARGHALTTPLSLTGNEVGQEVWGNAGANVINGAGGSDTLVGLGGNDIYYVDHEGDRIVEASGGGTRDLVYASTDYVLNSGAEVEVLSAWGHASTAPLSLTGNELGQEVWGNAGANFINGAGGNDVLIGLGGADHFVFSAALGPGSLTRISDFAPGVDRIALGGASNQPFAALASGALRSGAFVVGSSASDADDVIIYNAATGALLYDADGNGAGAAVQFARLSSGLNLSAADFVVLGPANNLPVIGSGSTASIAENSSVNTIVYQTAASDPDGDRVTFALAGPDAGAFTIDASGAVRLVSPADFETQSSYSITIVASDSSPNATLKDVTVTVTDVADTSTPIIAETTASNDNQTVAQLVDRSILAIAPNPNLANDDLPSVTIEGSISSSSDKDFFAITLQAGELLILDVDNSGGNLDAFLRAFTSGGTEIVFNDDLVSADPGSDPHPEYGHNTDPFLRFRAPETGTYYFSIESFQDPEHPTSGSYQLHVSVGPPATNAEILAEDVQALLSGFSWPSSSLTYAFPNETADYPGFVGDPANPELGSFAMFNSAQQAATQQLLLGISQVSGLTFQQLLDDSESSASLRFAMTDATEAAHAYYPAGDPESGTAWFNKIDFNNPVRGSYEWMGILHETGHTLGLKHGHEGPAVSPNHDTLEYTVMTYRSYFGGPIEGGYSNETWGYPQTLMMLDISALQQLYGANFAHNSGDSVYTWSTTSGEMFVNGIGQGAPGGNRIFLTIWDGGGNDTYDFSNFGASESLLIDLRPGEWIVMGLSQRANLGDGHFARGNIANALQYNNDSRSLIENAIGGPAHDILIGNSARNQLSGGGHTDTFKWYTAADCGLGDQADIVVDWEHMSDFIDLSAIDAVVGTSGDDAFTFIGTNAFSSVAGQLRYQVEGDSIRLQGDIDGDSIADLEISLNNTTSIDPFYIVL